MAIVNNQYFGDGVARLATGDYLTDATAAAVTFTIGFKARYVKGVNVNASGDVMLEWIEGMAAASAIKTAIDGTRSLITTLGITVADKTITFGLDTDLVVINEQMRWLAMA